MAIEPTKVNTGNGRPVTKIDVLNAENRGVEREQLNRILGSFDSRISVVEESSGNTPSSAVTTITADSTQINVVQDGNNYDLSLAIGGVTTGIIADNAVTTAKLTDASVTYAKIQNVTTDRLLGRDTASSGAVGEISLDPTLEFTGSDSIRRAALTGDVTAPAGSNTTTIANNAVTDAKLRQSAGLSVVGRSANSTGNVADITAGTDGDVLRRSGTTLGFGTIPNTSVTGLGTAATQNTGTSGANIPFLNGNNTWSGTNGFQAVSSTTLTTTGNATINGQLTLSGTVPRINLTDTNTGADSYVSADSSAGSLTFAADDNNETANSALNFRIDGSAVGSWATTGLSITGTLTTTGNAQLASLSVGIDTPIYEGRFHDASSDAYVLVSTGTTTNTVGLLFGDSASPVVGRIQYAHSADTMQFFSGGSERLRIDSGGADVTGALTVTSTISASNFAGSTWTPTTHNLSNLSSATGSSGQYLRAGNTVTASVNVTVNASGAGACAFEMSLPVSSNLAAIGDLVGIGVTSLAEITLIYAETTNDRAKVEFIATSSGSRVVSVHFTYRVA